MLMEFTVEDYCTNKMHNELIIECLKVTRCYRVDISMHYLCGQLSEGHSPNPGGRPPEAHVDHLVMETQGLKNLGSLKIEIRPAILRSVTCINRNQRGHYKISAPDKTETLSVITRSWPPKKIN